ncbi:MAG: FHA domain-containing protein, partial [Anaerolineales bacterium]
MLLLLLLPQLADAQGSTLASLSAPQTDAFPQISAYLEVCNEEGRFVTGLAERNITILENEQRLPVDALEELRLGAQLVVAINPGTTFAIRDVQGITRYNFLVEALDAWVQSLDGEDIDDLSLLMNGVPDVAHLSNPDMWLEMLREAPSDHRNALPSLQVLSRAIRIASDPTPREGMGRAVLFITPNLTRDSIPALESLTSQANLAGVRVFVWMVSSEAYFTTQGAIVLQEMAFATGGEYFAFSGTEPIPDVETYLEPLRSIYSLSYTSKITNQGEHQLAVEIDLNSLKATSPIQTFDLAVQPPNPMLVSPPSDIYRSVIPDTTNNLAGYTPDRQTIEILIEFPDGYERPLARTTLYVNGKIAAENTSEPFDVFTWNLSAVDESNRYTIQVEAVDLLGLSSVSMETPVDITVQRLPEGFAAEVSRNGSVLSAVLVLISGSVLILALVMVARRRSQLRPGKSRRREKRKQNDPIELIPASTESVSPRGLTRWASQLPSRLHWPQRGNRSEPFAFLERVVDPDSLETLTPTNPIPLTAPEITLGTDPGRATLVLEEPSVAGLHARLRRDRDGSVYLSDHGSVAGTWVNYTQTNAKGILLEHGDVIHIGRIGFRFKLNHPPRSYQP